VSTHQVEEEDQVAQRLQALRPVPPRDPEIAARRRAAFLQSCQRVRLARESVPYRRPQLRVAAMLVGLVLVLISSTGLMVSASQVALPGDSLYPVKLAAEGVAIALSFGPAARARQAADRALRRAQEIEILALTAPERIQEEDLARFQRHSAAAQAHADSLAPELAPLTEALRQRLQEATAVQEGALRRVRGQKAPFGPQQPGAGPPDERQAADRVPATESTPNAPQPERRGPSGAAPTAAPGGPAQEPASENTAPHTPGGASPSLQPTSAPPQSATQPSPSSSPPGPDVTVSAGTPPARGPGDQGPGSDGVQGAAGGGAGGGGS
jgi:hypothetical protein